MLPSGAREPLDPADGIRKTGAPGFLRPESERRFPLSQECRGRFRKGAGFGAAEEDEAEAFAQHLEAHLEIPFFVEAAADARAFVFLEDAGFLQDGAVRQVEIAVGELVFCDIVRREQRVLSEIRAEAALHGKRMIGAFLDAVVERRADEEMQAVVCLMREEQRADAVKLAVVRGRVLPVSRKSFPADERGLLLLDFAVPPGRGLPFSCIAAVVTGVQHPRFFQEEEAEHAEDRGLLRDVF